MEIEKYGTTGAIEELLAVRDSVDALANAHVPNNAVVPRADLFDRGSDFQVLLEVPGVGQENLEIAIDGDELVIAGLREARGDGDMIFSKRPVGPFQRSVRLPAEVDRDRATAHLMAGLLTVTLPKA